MARLIGLSVALVSVCTAAEVKTFTGTKRVPVVKSTFSQAKENQKALDLAETLATVEAAKNAIVEVMGFGKLDPSVLDATAQDLADNSPGFSQKTVLESRIDGADAKVIVSLRMNMAAMQEHLKQKGIKLTKGIGAKTNIFVLTCTVEGADPDRDRPIILHEETRDNRKNVVSSSFAHAEASDSSRSQSKSLQAAHSSSDKGAVASQSNESLKASNSAEASASTRGDASLRARSGDDSFSAQRSGSADAHARQDSKLEANASKSASGNWDQRSAASLDARSASASRDARSSSASGSQFSDTSTEYFRVVDYADPTKKGAAQTNDVRAKLEGAFWSAGMKTRTLDIKLQGPSFKNEDDFITYVLEKARNHPDVKGTDHIVIAINSFTPHDKDKHRFSSKITFRAIRVRDGNNFIRSDSISKTGRVQESDDDARNQALELSLMSLDDLLPKWVRQGIQSLDDEAKEGPVQAALYSVELRGISERKIVVDIKNIFKRAGFGVSNKTTEEGAVEIFTIDLGTHSLDDVKDLLDASLPSNVVVVQKNDSLARLKVR